MRTRAPAQTTAGSVRLLAVRRLTTLVPGPDVPRPAFLDDAITQAIQGSFRGQHDGQRTTVVLQCDHAVMLQVAERCWGDRQRLNLDAVPGSPRPHRLSFICTGPSALVPWLLQFGGGVEVVRPVALRAEVRAAAATLAQVHAASGDAPTDTGVEEPAIPYWADRWPSPLVGVTADAIRKGVATGITPVMRNPPPPRPRRGQTTWRPMIQGS